MFGHFFDKKMGWATFWAIFVDDWAISKGNIIHVTYIVALLF
jgi:hypothetical protein